MAKTIDFKIRLNVDGKSTVVSAAADAKDLSKALAGAQTSAGKLRDSLMSFGALQLTFQGLQNGLQSITGVLNNLTEESRAYVGAMKAANTMAGKDAAGFEKLKDQVTELSKVIPLTRDELAKGLYQVISNGVPEDNWISYLEASSRSAVGGIANLEEVVKVTSTVIKNYGLEWSAAQDIQDKIQLTAKNGVTSFEQLAAALPSVTGQAAQLGVSFSEMLAVMSTLTGVTGNTSEVSTQLASVLTALTKESSKSQKMADAMGISFNAASVKAAGGLQNYLKQLDSTVTAYASKTGMLKESIYSQLFGRAEALRLVNALTGNLSDKFAENIKTLDDSAGTIDAAFEEMASTGSASLQKMKNAFGGLVDHIQGTVSAISPILNFATQIGMTTLAVMSLNKAFIALRGSTVAAAVATGVQNTATKIGALYSKLWTAQLYQAQRAQIAWAFGAKLCAVQATALRVAMMALGVAIPLAAVAGIIALFGGFTGSMKEATGASQGLQNALETQKAAEEEATRVSAEARVEIDNEVRKLDELIKSKGDTSAAVKHLNEKYGEWFGQCSTAQQWYDTLISKSQAYCLQLGYEAQMRVYQEKKAQLEIRKLRNQQDRDELKKSGGDKVTAYTTVGTSGTGFTQTGTYVTESEESKKLNSQAAEIDAELTELDKNINATQTLIDKNKSNLPDVPTTPTGGGGTDDKKKNKNKTKTGKKDNDKHLIADPKTYEQLTNNVAYYEQQLERANVKDEAAIATLQKKKQAAEDAVKAYTDMMESLGLPTEMKSLDDYDKKLQWLRKKRQDADKDSIAGIDKEIAELEKERKVLEDTSIASMRDEDIKTYDELNRKLAYYNSQLERGDEEQRIMAQRGIDSLNKLKKAWDDVLAEQALPESAVTIEDIDKSISFYNSRQQTEDADQIEKTQRLIEKLEAQKKAMMLGTELPKMQKEIEDIQKLSGYELKMKVSAYGFDELTEKIRNLREYLDNADNPVTANQRKEIEDMISVYEGWRRQAVMSMDTVRDGWSSFRGLGDSISSVSNALEGNASAWQTVTSLVDGFISIYEGINSIIAIIQMLTAVSHAHATAKMTEAAASTAAGTAEAASAAGAEAAAAAELPTIAVNKLAAASYLELASAAYFAAHAAIPMVGFGIGAGFTAAAKAMVLAIGATPFADGGIIKGPTLGLIGEYAGASHNPEVVAPLDRLRGMLQPSGMSGKVRFEIEARKLVGVLANETSIASKSGRRTNIHL